MFHSIARPLICILLVVLHYVSIANASRCDSYKGYAEVLDSCLKLHNTRKSWTLAEEVCEKEGAHLATITSVLKDRKIASYFSSSVDEGFWIGLSNAGAGWGWQTQEEVSFENWNEYSVPKGGTCGRHVGKHWEAISCDVPLKFLCEVYEVSPRPVDGSGGSFESYSLRGAGRIDESDSDLPLRVTFFWASHDNTFEPAECGAVLRSFS
mmetsp:Transcript_28238/g.47763  ORF Transcript_28238/g.47763 Transcript_28238/m.47763 type:complete len:209 (-) Transcript_28238:1599-2225(-)